MITDKDERQKGSQGHDGFRTPSLHPGSERSADEQSTQISDKPTKNDTGEGRELSGKSEEHALASKLMSIRKYMDDELLTAAKIASVTQANGNNDDARLEQLSEDLKQTQDSLGIAELEAHKYREQNRDLVRRLGTIGTISEELNEENKVLRLQNEKLKAIVDTMKEKTKQILDMCCSADLEVQPQASI
jgi:hypothetical protein